MNGDFDYNILKRCHEICITNEKGDKCYTFKVEEHDITEGHSYNVTKIAKNGIAPWVALAKVFQKMKLIAGDATTTELKATKDHLNDMRSLVFNKKPSEIDEWKQL